MIYSHIKKLVDYGIKKKLMDKTDECYVINLIMSELGLDDFINIDEDEKEVELEVVLDNILSWAVENKVIEDGITSRDLFDTKLMGFLTPRPSSVVEKFNELYEQSPQKATDYFYNLSIDSDYIRKYRVEKDKKWKYDCEFGELDITINLSKPEKDPKAIAAAKTQKQSGYPKCMLCKENVGFKGTLNHPARQNLRVIPTKINNEQWYFQYSPYVYYNEHCIVFKGEHDPMKVDKSTFRKLLDFVNTYPHYMVGSNADLPIVGGSILTHDHFQGGNYEFPMAKAQSEIDIKFDGFENVKACIIKWPMSVIRLNSNSDEDLVELANKILLKWRYYSDESSFIFSHSGDEPHNTITPIARMKDGSYELDLVLRNNITTEEHPLGVYHPHSELHNIKKENIGLIEVMGLAVLPSRLKIELEEIQSSLVTKTPLSENLAHHKQWVDKFSEKYDDINVDNVQKIIEDEVGEVFLTVLSHAGVYKCTAESRSSFMNFIHAVNER